MCEVDVSGCSDIVTVANSGALFHRRRPALLPDSFGTTCHRLGHVDH